MASNQVYISYNNPVRMVPAGIPEYINFDSDWYANQIYKWNEKTNYAQKWVTGMDIRFQFKSNFAPVVLNVLDCRGNLIASYTPSPITTGLYPDGFVYYEKIFAVPDTTDYWYIQLQVGFADTLTSFISEPQQTVAKSLELLVFEVGNSFNDADMYLADGRTFMWCCEGIITNIAPKSSRSVWQDQTQNLKNIKAIPYREFTLSLGGTYNTTGYQVKGVPEYIADKINRYFCWNYTKINGIQYTMADGSNWNVASVQGSQLNTYSTSIRPTKNITSLISENNNTPAEAFFVTYNINSKLFGVFNGNSSDTIIQITNVE